MTSEQFSPRPDLLKGQTESVANDTENRVKELLGRHQDLVAPSVAQQIIEREVSRAVQEYGAKRLEGRANDNYSKAPGVTIYMTNEAKVAISALFDREPGYSIPPEQWRSLPNNIWEVSFPRGIYSMGGGGCQFYQEADDDFDRGRRDRVRRPFTAGYDDIVRVEGKSGELWQNANYNWDGTPKTR
ncbi:MAG: hypothetical protein UT84_C0022G0010 [Candidatus Curtissbacteria bacterium GW2011_GWA1_40_16]|uniref:Uncharacterized protein n=1 Tax=Candidatus Curtissbacteria bacterium GW2011_GWA1_40_16 TaxID=1618405 RepID=A0A0G0UHN2_9BACT|nr:MAG: hypothetical protein UT84_C0022G0010 [Candidatus Curtissbacteria bacterium GW2011_GWA1_40_16]